MFEELILLRDFCENFVIVYRSGIEMGIQVYDVVGFFMNLLNIIVYSIDYGLSFLVN